MLTRNIDYRIQGYHQEMTFDTKGDLVTVKYYEQYDGVTYANLKVQETRVYTRDADTGLLIKRDMTIEWFDNAGNKRDEKTTEKYYDAQKGYSSNIRARKNLVNKGSMYLYADLQSEFGAAQGETNAKEFLRDIKSEIVNYERGDIQELLDAVQGSTRGYMTSANGLVRKATLDALLNIAY